jgi:hypothetical protein
MKTRIDRTHPNLRTYQRQPLHPISNSTHAFFDINATSTIIGNIMLVALTVLIVGVVAVWAFVHSDITSCGTWEIT